MVSTFHGLETSKRAILTNSIALHTLGHNISNASTLGYSRQRVNLSTAIPVYAPGFTRPNTPGQIGTGVQYTSITRLRDSYLDLQFRRENQNLGINSIYQSTMRSIEAIVNEPSTNGVSTVMNKFWDSLEVLNRDPNLLSARVDFIGNAKNLADTFNHIGTSFTTLENDINSNINIKLNEANNIISDIAQMNEIIRKVESLGDHANDYKDQRDLLIDNLSRIVDVQYAEDVNGMVSLYVGGAQVLNGAEPTALTAADVTNITSGEIAGYNKSLAEISLVRNQMNALVDTLVNGQIEVTMPNGYKTSTDMVALNDVTGVDSSGNQVSYTAGTTIPADTKITSSVTFQVAGFNGLHKLGYSLNEPAETGINFFTTKDGSSPFTIDNIQVNLDIQADTNKVAASGQFERDSNGDMIALKGNSDIALALTSLRDVKFNFPSGMTALSTGTTDDYFRAFVSDLGTRASVANSKYKTSLDMVDGVEIRRQSTSGVAIDEELSDLIRFQHAYTAAARNMTVVDELLDKVINSMGLVGR
ncbi:flagellar hook-associated protein FlgK [Paenibacillus sp. GXUN7292]|uniref:flagellar hook-associated protein FlgK n=1 Tax=Paenibacillus sp. GXUN7292 TaxID=3422499 RepID=UPI003D7D9FFB